MGLNLDWKRFVTERTGVFLRIKEYMLCGEGAAPASLSLQILCTTHAVGLINVFDLVDIVSWDAYPLWHFCARRTDCCRYALQHDRCAVSAKGPLLLMESALSSGTNWQPVSRL